MEFPTSFSTVTSTPIGLRDWIQSTCKSQCKISNVEVERAIILACFLTNLIDETAAASAGLKLEHFIKSENVVIFAKHPPSTPQELQGQGTATNNALVVTDVQWELSCVLSLLSCSNSTQPSCPRAVCVALGKILLEIFSMGRSESESIGCFGRLANENGNGNTPSERCTESYDSTSMLPPPVKRQGTAPMDGSLSSKTNNLLLELGMPLSIRQLVCDLLFDTESDTSCARTTIKTFEEALCDLNKMKNNPELFLFDRTCPQRALDDTGLFGGTEKHLFDREAELRLLFIAKNKVSVHVNVNTDNKENPINDRGVSVSTQCSNFLCEAVFLSGYAGSGKSSILYKVALACNEEKWFMLSCKFDKQAAPHMVLAKAFDAFFGKWGPSYIGGSNIDDLNPGMGGLIESFQTVCSCVFSTLDGEGLHQLCDLVPNFARIFPVLTLMNTNQDDRGIASMDKVGSAKKRLQNLFHVLFNSLCSAGVPVFFTLDDLQWSESSVMEVVAGFVDKRTHDSSRLSDGTPRQGLFVVGTYRSNEVKESDDLIRIINSMKQKANVTMLTVSELTKDDITKLISTKLCLPCRYVQELAQLVHSKTRGNAFFVISFLRSIIQNKMLEFSVKSRRYMWDCDVVEMQMISKEVAELLTTTFSQLPATLMSTVKIASCLGSQVEESTIEAMNNRHEILPFNMLNELQQAVKEGIMEKAGPMYQFTHDIVHQTVYDLIPLANRSSLHKTIGKNLLKSAANNPTVHLLAMDQINNFCADGNPGQDERSEFAASNALAAKFAIASSSFIQARSYIDKGLLLLDTQPWERQYSLALDLFEMSASVSCMHGDINSMSTCLDAILSHTRTFEDSLKASSLLVKLLTSTSKFDEAQDNCLMILSTLGEKFPTEVTLPCVLNELSGIQTSLRDISCDQIKLLSPMTDKIKLNSMKFLNMLCMCSAVSKPMMLPLLSCRMFKLMNAYGFCDDAIVGLATVGYSVFLFTEDIHLATRIGKVCEVLIERSSNKHVLRTRLGIEVYTTLKMIKEPWHSVVALFPEFSNSAMLAGDSEGATKYRWIYCFLAFWTASLDLCLLLKHTLLCFKELAKNQNNILYSITSLVHTCAHLTGRSINDIEIKSLDELSAIGDDTNNAFLVWQTFMCRMINHFWMRKYMTVAELSEKYSEKYPLSSQEKRNLARVRIFVEGIAYLSLARDTKQVKWRILGEKAAAKISQFEMTSKWNFQHRSELLQAELHYLDGDIVSAEALYKTSIISAHRHRFIQEEALAYELYGIFCVENNKVGTGHKQLHIAIGKYKQWGAMKKAEDLQRYIELVDCWT